MIKAPILHLLAIIPETFKSLYNPTKPFENPYKAAKGPEPQPSFRSKDDPQPVLPPPVRGRAQSGVCLRRSARILGCSLGFGVTWRIVGLN